MTRLFEIGIVDPRTGAFVGIGTPGIASDDAGDATFRLIVDDRAYVGEDWSLGPLELLVQQLDDALVRLRDGRVALVRSGVEDQLEVPYFLFEPAADLIHVSAFLIPDRSMGSVFPIDVHGHGHDSGLYEYVAENREQLLGADDDDTFREVPVPREPLIDAVESALLEAMDVG